MARTESDPHPPAICAPTVNVGRDASRTIVWLGGEHDIASTAMVAAALRRAVRVERSDVVVDLSGIRFLGAATLGSILRVRRILWGQGRTLVLRSPSPSARRLLDVCLVNVTVEPRATRPSTRRHHSTLAIESGECRHDDLARSGEIAQCAPVSS